jgi:hypothetical protein
MREALLALMSQVARRRTNCCSVASARSPSSRPNRQAYARECGAQAIEVRRDKREVLCRAEREAEESCWRRRSIPTSPPLGNRPAQSRLGPASRAACPLWPCRRQLRAAAGRPIAAFELALTAARWTAQEAHAAGLLNRVVDPDEALAGACALGRDIALNARWRLRRRRRCCSSRAAGPRTRC